MQTTQPATAKSSKFYLLQLQIVNNNPTEIHWFQRRFALGFLNLKSLGILYVSLGFVDICGIDPVLYNISPLLSAIFEPKNTSLIQLEMAEVVWV